MFFWLTVIRDDIDMNKYLFLNRNKNRKVDDEDVEECFSSSFRCSFG